MQLALRSEAEADLREAYDWYEQQRAGLGGELLAVLESTFHSILENPSRFAVVHREVRRALTRRFPFGVFYLVEMDCIVILAILHASRNPSTWRTRVE